MDLRAQLERTAGGVVAAGRAAAPSTLPRLLTAGAAALALSLLATYTLGASVLARTTPMLLGEVATNFLLVAGLTVALHQLRRDVFRSGPVLGLFASLIALTIGAQPAACAP